MGIWLCTLLVGPVALRRNLTRWHGRSLLDPMLVPAVSEHTLDLDSVIAVRNNVILVVIVGLVNIDDPSVLVSFGLVGSALLDCNRGTRWWTGQEAGGRIWESCSCLRSRSCLLLLDLEFFNEALRDGNNVLDIVADLTVVVLPDDVKQIEAFFRVFQLTKLEELGDKEVDHGSTVDTNTRFEAEFPADGQSHVLSPCCCVVKGLPRIT